jgi:nucleoside 2-deoxyribosyltransferase
MLRDKDGRLLAVAKIAQFTCLLKDWGDTFERWKEIGLRYGILCVGTTATDREFLPVEMVTAEPGTPEYVQSIFDNDLAIMAQCDLCISQLDNWRSQQPDSGTVWETGYYLGQGKPCFGFYTPEAKARDTEAYGVFTGEDGIPRDRDGYAWEQPLDSIFALVEMAEDFEGACRLARERCAYLWEE